MPRDAAENLSVLPDDFKVLHICESIKHANTLVTRHLVTENRNFWKDVLFPQFHLAPIMHDLLSMPRITEQDDAAEMCRELFRLAAVLYLRRLWAPFGMDKSGEAQYLTKLQRIWTEIDFATVWAFDPSILQWISAVVALHSAMLDGEQGDVEPLQQNQSQHRSELGNLHLTGTMASQLWCESVLGPLECILPDDSLPERWTHS